MRLRLEGVCKRYGRRHVLRGIDLLLEGGTILLLTGANGAGKTTLLRIAGGLIAPDAGQVRHEGIGAAGIGYLGHETAVYPALSALENLRFWQALYRRPASPPVLRDALDRAGLLRRMHDPAASFSRGMLQRLNLARLMLQRPDLLLLDEPSSGLDAASAALLREELLLVRQRQAGVILVSHRKEQDGRIADRVVELADTRLVAEGQEGGGPCCARSC
jgi:heme exporter protein A